MADIKEFPGDGFTIRIDYDICEGHGECEAVCAAGVFEVADEKCSAPRAEDCIECCACVEACPTGALEHDTC